MLTKRRPLRLCGSVHSAQNVYREQDVDGNGTLDYANILQLYDEGLISQAQRPAADVWSYVLVHGYKFFTLGEQQTYAGLFTWSLAASPEGEVSTEDSDDWDSGRRRFFVDQTGVIRYCVSSRPVSSYYWAQINWPTIGK